MRLHAYFGSTNHRRKAGDVVLRLSCLCFVCISVHLCAHAGMCVWGRQQLVWLMSQSPSVQNSTFFFPPSLPLLNNKSRSLFILEHASTLTFSCFFCIWPGVHAAEHFGLTAESLLWCFFVGDLYPLASRKLVPKKIRGVCMQDTSTRCPQCVCVCVSLGRIDCWLCLHKLLTDVLQ